MTEVRYSSREWWEQVAASGRMAAVLDPADRRGHKNLYIDLIQRLALEEVLRIDGAVVLDFGCGSGRFLPMAISRAKYVVGLDISEKLLQYAREAAVPGRAEVVHFDGRTLPFPPEHFDVVLSVGTLQCLTDDAHFTDMIGQLVAAVKPGGRIYLLEQGRLRPNAWQRRSEEYVEAFTRRGCSCVRCYPVRTGRSLMLYAIRYGLVPRRFLPALARHELRTVRNGRPSPWATYQDFLFEFTK
jgi:SAM-dependent methyltransferase